MHRCLARLIVFTSLCSFFTLPAVAQKEARDLNKPTSIQDLLAVQTRVEAVLKTVIPATVGVRIGRAQGSGVIVSEDGYVLTAAHVSGSPGKNVTLILPDGKEVKGKTLGLNRGVDAGLIKITEKGQKWPHVEMGDLLNTSNGDWCIATGHPGGYKKGRPPVVRLGRIIRSTRTVVQSGCTLVGGDSGGPLFDLDGKVIGIHSRIGAGAAWNFHVPISAYSTKANWDRLVKSEEWGGRPQASTNPAILGVNGEDHEKGCKITNIAANLPAERAGLKVGDVITTFDGKEVEGFDALYRMVGKKKPGDKVILEFLRDGKVQKKETTLARRP